MESKKKVVILVALILILIISWLFLFRRASLAKKKLPIEKTEKERTSIEMMLTTSRDLKRIRRELREEQAGLKVSYRNPLIPSFLKRTAEEESVSLVLSGIVYDGEEPLAIIDDSVLKTGDSISGLKIIRISPETVILSDNKRRVTLNLEEGKEGEKEKEKDEEKENIS